MTTQAGERNRVDDALEALSNTYRRQLLLALLREGPQADTDTDPLDLVESGEPEAVAAMLFHSHLPKLHAMGVIEWDRAAGEIRKGDHWDSVAPLLALIDENLDDLPAGFL